VIGYQADIGPAYERCLYDESRIESLAPEPGDVSAR